MATTYYVAAAGSAGFSGLSPLLPKQTYAQANALAVSGDTVLGNGGDIFREQVSAVSGVTYKGYGTNQPRITGADLLNSGWSSANTTLPSDGSTVSLWRFDGNLNDSGPNGRTLYSVAGSPTYVGDC